MSSRPSALTRRILAVAGLVASVGLACDLSEAVVDAHLESARQLAAQGRLEDATREVRLAIERDPDNAAAHLSLSRLLNRQGDTPGAVEAARRAVELDPTDVAAQAQLGRLVFTSLAAGDLSGDAAFGEASRAFDAAIAGQAEGAGPGLAIERAQLLSLWAGHEAEAVEAFSALLDQSEVDPQARLRLGRAAADAARRAGDEALRERALRAVIDVDPGAADAWRELAAIRRERGEDELAWLDAEIAARPGNAELRILRAQALARADRRDEAESELLAAAEAGVEPARMKGAVVELRLKSGDVEGARALAARIEQEYPGSAEAAVASAQLAIHEVRLIDALDTLEGLSERVENAQAEQMRALVYHRLLRPGDAARAIERSQRIDPAFDAGRTRLAVRIFHAAARPRLALSALAALEEHGLGLRLRELLIRAQSAYALGEIDGGDALVAVLVEREPPYPDAVVEFASRHLRDQPDRVAAAVERGLAVAPDHGGLVRARAELDIAGGRPDLALERIDAVLESGGEISYPTAVTRAEALLALDRRQEAENDLLNLIRTVPAAWEALRVLARLHRDQGGLDELVTSFQAAEKTRALGGEGAMLTARLEMFAGRWADAEARLAAMPEIQQGPAMKADWARSLAELGRDPERAQAMAEEAIDQLGRDPEAHDALGLVWLKRGRPQAAASLFTRAEAYQTSAGTTSPDPALHLGQALRETGSPEAAARAFERALALDPGCAAARAGLDALAAPAGDAGEGP